MRLHMPLRLGARLSEHGGETPAEVWLLHYGLRPGRIRTEFFPAPNRQSRESVDCFRLSLFSECQ